MKISAVIATYNRRQALANCLAKLFDQNLPSDQYEIVVVIDGSFDGTSEMLKSFRAQNNLVVVEQENQGQAAARNAGAIASTGEIVLFLDDDLLCDRGLISAHLAAHDHAQPALVFGRTEFVLAPSPSLANTMMKENLEKYYSRLAKDPLPKWPDDAWAGPNCSTPRAAFLAAGGYDEKLFPRRGEDSDLGLRLWKMGLHFRYAPRAITSHRWLKSERQFWADTEKDGANSITLCRKHPELRSRSWLAGAMSGQAWKRHAARLVTRPLAARPLGALVTAFEKIARPRWARRIAMRLFDFKQKSAMLAGARREAGSWETLQSDFGKRLPVLLFHRVGPPQPGTYPDLTVSPAQFERQTRWLARGGYMGIRPSDWLAWRREAKALPAKPILLTFDDAYADTAEFAFPVLKRYGFSAGVFVVTGQLGGTNAWDEARGSHTLRLMTAEQIRYWATQGIEFGAHSRTHPDLRTLNAAEREKEVAGGARDLAAVVGKRVVSFAYPYGDYNEAVCQSVAGAFDLAFTCEDGLNGLATNPHLLRRTVVGPNDSLIDLWGRVKLGHSPLRDLRARLRIRTRLKHALGLRTEKA